MQELPNEVRQTAHLMNREAVVEPGRAPERANDRHWVGSRNLPREEMHVVHVFDGLREALFALALSDEAPMMMRQPKDSHDLFL